MWAEILVMPVVRQQCDPGQVVFFHVVGPVTLSTIVASVMHTKKRIRAQHKQAQPNTHVLGVEVGVDNTGIAEHTFTQQGQNGLYI